MKKPRRSAAAPSSEEPPAFEAIRVGVECVFFVRTRPPVDPTALVLAICEDAAACDDRQKRRTRFVNRLTPVVTIEKANITGVEEVAHRVLAGHFQLVAATAGDNENGGGAAPEEKKKEDEVEACSVSPRHPNCLRRPCTLHTPSTPSARLCGHTARSSGTR